MSYFSAFLAGRLRCQALASMNVRAVVIGTDVRYVARPFSELIANRHRTAAAFQARDEAGRFVSYAALERAIEIQIEQTVT